MVKAAYLVFIASIVAFLSASAAILAGGEEKARRPDNLEFLSRIYKEVKELGPYPGQDFIRWDFFMGEGDDDTHKPIQAVILIQSREQGERMVLLVSRMEASPANPNVYWNKGSKEISCLVRDDKAEIVFSEYTPQELEQLLPGLLLAVQDKKKLLRGD